MVEPTRGDLVWIWFDTGAMGSNILYGRVIAAGAKTYRVRWESGLTNRITRNGRRVEPKLVEPRERATAIAAMKKAEAARAVYCAKPNRAGTHNCYLPVRHEGEHVGTDGTRFTSLEDDA
jgi:hypothetical protein